MTRSRFWSSLLPAVVVGLALLLSAFFLARALVRSRAGDDGIRVIGSARKSIRSDFIIWRGRVTQNAPTVKVAYAQLQTNVERVRSYLLRKGIAANEMFPTAVVIKSLYAKTDNASDYESDANSGVYRPIVSYQLSQEIEVRSSKVAVVDAISRQSTELISSGVPLSSVAPMYIYTKLSDLKVTMQADAARDARARAEQIAQNSGCALGEVRYARMSAPSITPLYGTQESDGGVDDTTSLDKKITAIVVVGYATR